MFHRPSFSTYSFNAVSFNGQTDEVRSGYWRLWLTELQEQSNLELEKKFGKSENNVAPVVVATAKKKVVVPKSKSDHDDAVEKFPFVPLPAYRAIADKPTYLRQIWDATTEMRNLIGEIERDAVELSKSDIVDEDDVELLLLLLC